MQVPHKPVVQRDADWQTTPAVSRARPPFPLEDGPDGAGGRLWGGPY